MNNFRDNSIFWIEVEKIRPNPEQPRISFDEERLRDLSDSIKQYGVLQPLVVIRAEEETDGGGLRVYYELIAGERRLRASKLAGLSQVPALIRTGEDNKRAKLELAIIENLQREDLNPVDRARALKRLSTEFGLNNAQIGRKVGKSREYVSNTLRMLQLPDDMVDALAIGKITEGHTRPLLMLADQPDVQRTFFKDILGFKMAVREAEIAARRYAQHKVRKREHKINPEIYRLEQQFSEKLGTRVLIDQKDKGGRLVIEYFAPSDLQALMDLFETHKLNVGANTDQSIREDDASFASENSHAEEEEMKDAIDTPLTNDTEKENEAEVVIIQEEAKEEESNIPEAISEEKQEEESTPEPVVEQKKVEDNTDDLYSMKNFSI